MTLGLLDEIDQDKASFLWSPCRPTTKHTSGLPINQVFLLYALGAFEPTIYKDPTGNQEVLVDGGVIYNYPLHCYDG